jgi:hypothetical protein
LKGFEEEARKRRIKKKKTPKGKMGHLEKRIRGQKLRKKCR